jgi:hypothetical protein
VSFITHIGKMCDYTSPVHGKWEIEENHNIIILHLKWYKIIWKIYYYKHQISH